MRLYDPLDEPGPDGKTPRTEASDSARMLGAVLVFLTGIIIGVLVYLLGPW